MEKTSMAKPTFKHSLSMPTDREVRVERVFNATPERLWRAFTDPDQVAQWWGRGNKLVIEKWEPKRGGHWRVVEHSPHGIHGFEGRYREVTPHERIVRSFEWDGMPAHVLIEHTDFIDLRDGRTKLVTVSLYHTQAERDGMMVTGAEAGMNQSYEALDALLATP